MGLILLFAVPIELVRHRHAFPVVVAVVAAAVVEGMDVDAVVSAVVVVAVAARDVAGSAFQEAVRVAVDDVEVGVEYAEDYVVGAVGVDD